MKRPVPRLRLPIETHADAAKFMKSMKFALRYKSTPKLPLVSMYAAAGDDRLAAELTNAMLAGGEVIETNVIADRLVLVHRDVAPALYALRIRRRAANLSEKAARVFRLIEEDGSLTAGEARRFLGVAGLKRPDAADLALSELQREMLVDRGPAAVPKTGMPYLSKEGYPYRVFDKAHPEVVKAAKKIQSADAVKLIVSAFDQVSTKKIASMFKLCFTESEIA